MTDLLVAAVEDAVGEQWRHYTDPVPVAEDRSIRSGDKMAGAEGGARKHLKARLNTRWVWYIYCGSDARR